MATEGHHRAALNPMQGHTWPEERCSHSHPHRGTHLLLAAPPAPRCGSLSSLGRGEEAEEREKRWRRGRGGRREKEEVKERMRRWRGRRGASARSKSQEQSPWCQDMPQGTEDAPGLPVLSQTVAVGIPWLKGWGNLGERLFPLSELWQGRCGAEAGPLAGCVCRVGPVQGLSPPGVF